MHFIVQEIGVGLEDVDIASHSTGYPCDLVVSVSTFEASWNDGPGCSIVTGRYLSMMMGLVTRGLPYHRCDEKF